MNREIKLSVKYYYVAILAVVMLVIQDWILAALFGIIALILFVKQKNL